MKRLGQAVYRVRAVGFKTEQKTGKGTANVLKRIPLGSAGREL